MIMRAMTSRAAGAVLGALVWAVLGVGPALAQQSGTATPPSAPIIGEPSAPQPMPADTPAKPADPFAGGTPTSSTSQSQAGKAAPKTTPPGAKPQPLAERLGAAESGIRTLRQQVTDNARAIQELRMLHESDRKAVPEPANDLPPLNLKCEDDPECQQCITNVTQDLEAQLRLYEKLRIIYDRAKTYNDNAIMIGDVFSGYHQLEQQAWYATKLDLVKNFRGLQAAYDAKLEDFNGRLMVIFQKLDQCTPDVAGDITNSFETAMFLNTIKGAYRK